MILCRTTDASPSCSRTSACTRRQPQASYLAYRAHVGMSEADRTCVSNIHREGANPLEAGAHIADVIEAMLAQQTSGLKLVL